MLSLAKLETCKLRNFFSRTSSQLVTKEVAAEELDTEVGGEADTKQKKKVRRASEKGTVITHITVRLLVNATCYRF